MPHSIASLALRFPIQLRNQRGLVVAKATNVGVDFNERDESGNVVALPKYADGPVAVGDVVLLSDAEGNEVEGQVVDVTDRLIRVHPIWDTWVPAPEPDAVTTIGDRAVVVVQFTIGGEESRATVHAEDAPVVDLMAALRASLSATSVGTSQTEDITAGAK